MQIYRGTIELLDYVFYATVERGKVYETGAFIHNYALAYALGLVQGETYTYARLNSRTLLPGGIDPSEWPPILNACGSPTGVPPADSVEHPQGGICLPR